ncbi:beta-ketoacyl-[acyl-carrier-protein] synthase family protein [Kitasatospora kifunensis]|uniref:beta-ketoacyl-[acyl-carrier-protein] synthase family protein n=1 Tax=Kitasatospora kifunensis TaxID=58351 RepID=UPI00161E121A|nr:beta-ketoacyl-[acyl-carrier-protein] synthase family protein [Kitasatospora kifunensis]
MSTAAPPLAVTGIGLVTPAGIGTEASWRGVLAANPTAAHDPALTGLPIELACRVPGYDPRRHLGGRQPWRHDRATQFARTAAREALADARLDPADRQPDRLAVVLGSAAGGIGSYEQAVGALAAGGASALSPLALPAYLPNMAAGQLALDLDARGPVLHTATACASGAGALWIAALLLAAGACDIAVAGGSDAMVTRACVAAFARMGALSRNRDPAIASRPFDAGRDGFVIGEGAAVLVLERLPDAIARHAPVHALLLGWGSATDAHHAVAPHPEARGLEAALRQALAVAGAEPHEVGHVNAHGTGTMLNDRAEARLIARLLGQGKPCSVTSAKGVLGHTMGAAGAIEAALTALTVEHRIVPATAGHRTPDADTGLLDLVTGVPRRQRIDLAVSTSAGFGGHNVALAFAPPP